MNKSGIKLIVQDTTRRKRSDKIVIGTISRVAKNVIYENLYSFLYDDVDPKVPREVIPKRSKSGTVRELSTNADITVTVDEPNAYEVYVHFGSDKISKKYARNQHENLEYNHEIGESQFLMDPFLDFYPELVYQVENALKKSL